MYCVFEGDDGKELDVFLPKSVWYDWYTHEQVSDGLVPKQLKVPTPLDHVPVSILILIKIKGLSLLTGISEKSVITFFTNKLNVGSFYSHW